VQGRKPEVARAVANFYRGGRFDETISQGIFDHWVAAS